MKIALATTGQPSTNPRLIKEANSLVEAGYQVVVFYMYWTNWAAISDTELLKTVKWQYHLIGGSPKTDRFIFLVNKLRAKGYQKLAHFSNIALAEYRCRAFHNLLKVLKKDKADHYIAHNLGALAPVAQAAEYNGSTFSFDAEDFHRGQYSTKSSRDQEIDVWLENKYLPRAKFITTASPLITEYYQAIYPQLKFTTINNVFPKAEFTQQITENYNEPLKLVWFSQTVGPNRGIEHIIAALNSIKKFKVTLNLFGNSNKEVQSVFNSLLQNNEHEIVFSQPLMPSLLNLKLSEFDIGIASEIVIEKNRNICLTNKIFSYIQAGLCILASNTEAQTKLLAENKGIGFIYENDNIEKIVEILSDLHYNRKTMHRCKTVAINLGKRLNWDIEKHIFLKLINQTF